MQEDLKFDDPKFRLILDHAIGLFSEFGIRNINMDDISRKVGISKRTLYQYVKSKEDLIERLFYYDQFKWDNEFSKLKLDEMNAIEILLQVSLLVIEEMGRLDPKTKYELKKYYEFIYNGFMEKKQSHIFDHISKNIRKGINEGLYRDDVNVDLVAGLYVRNLVDLHNKDYCLTGNSTFGQVFQVLFESHIRAISTPEGIAYFEKRKSEINQLKNIL
jgi:AcrR family transcriptional regulator